MRPKLAVATTLKVAGPIPNPKKLVMGWVPL